MEVLQTLVDGLLSYGPLGILVGYVIWDKHMTRKRPINAAMPVPMLHGANGNGRVSGHDTKIALIEQRLDSIEKKADNETIARVDMGIKLQEIGEELAVIHTKMDQFLEKK